MNEDDLLDGRTVVEEPARMATEIPITHLRKILPERTKVWCPVQIGGHSRWVTVTKQHLKQLLKGWNRDTKIPGVIMEHEGINHVYLARWE